MSKRGIRIPRIGPILKAISAATGIDVTHSGLSWEEAEKIHTAIAYCDDIDDIVARLKSMVPVCCAKAATCKDKVERIRPKDEPTAVKVGKGLPIPEKGETVEDFLNRKRLWQRQNNRRVEGDDAEPLSIVQTVTVRDITYHDKRGKIHSRVEGSIGRQDGRTLQISRQRWGHTTYTMLLRKPIKITQ